MIARRLIELAALLMIGDGVVGFFKPRWHSLLWDVGPRPYRELMHQFAAEPGKARLAYAAEAVIGAFLATYQTPEVR